VRADLREMKRTVYMGFRGKVDDGIDAEFVEHA